MFSKEDKFSRLPVCLPGGRSLPKMGSTLKGKKIPMENSFLYETTLIYMGDNNEIDRVAFPESVDIHLKLFIPTVPG